MVIVHVHVHVKPEFVEAFRLATVENARNSVLEAGILRFDVIQQEDDPTRFVLIEIYRTVEATVAHKASKHYAAWQAVAEPMMAEPRSRARYTTVFPAEQDW
ncbi:MAG TPA: antibiotic biosynthesis monooxygenase [Bryobacteraceae bacterium]|nr:antibiotic biosynthesis monooxygenase [Bryobacteraceae bacterium]